MLVTQDPTDIVLVRDRDAHAAIRGFVYQIDLTLIRWLKLDDAEALLPERGEDIDVVARWMDGGGDQLLEQVKNLSNPITLNTPAVRGALAGFYEHRTANPGRTLHFRFSTNARAIRERTSYFPDRAAGIVVWNQTRLGPSPAPAQILTGIRKTFAEAPKPEELSTETWTSFTSFVANCSADDLERFVRAVEFSCELESDSETKPVVTKLLVSRGYCADVLEAEAGYLALFHHVTRLLCRSGPRRLLREDLAGVLRQGYATSPRVTMALKLLGERVSALEVEVREHAAKLARTDTSRSLTFTTSRDLTTPPPAPASAIDRTEVADALIAALAPLRFVAVTGQMGIGKTQLVRLAAERMRRPLAWLRLREIDPAEAGMRLGLVVEHFKDRTPPEVLVLDDMPLLNYASEPLRDRLVEIVSHPEWSNVRVVASSAGVHSATALSAFPTGSFAQFPVPSLTLGEAKSYVLALGGDLPDTALQYLLQVTSAHPQMFVAVCQYLAANGWQLGGKVLMGLLERRFADGLTAETAERFIGTVRDESTRELVQRMRLCVKRARTPQLHALSGVAPPITDPVTRAATLDGVWLQREAAGEWALSPLLQCLSSESLPEPRRTACHAALAHSFDVDGSLNVGDVRYVLHHMREGRLFDDFADLFRTVAVEALSRVMGTSGYVARGVLQMLSRVHLPTQLGEEERTVALALQLAVKLQLNEQVDPDVLAPILDAKLSASSTLLVAVTLGFRLRGRDAVVLIGRALHAADENTELHRQRYRLVAGLTSLVGDKAGIEALLDLLPVLTPEERKLVEEEELWPGGVLALLQQSLETVVDREQLLLAQAIQERAKQLGMPMLFAAAVRAQAMALATNDNAGALQLLETAVAETPPDARERGLMLAAVVQFAICAGDTTRAYEASSEAQTCGANGIEYQAAQCALRGAIAGSSLGQDVVPLARHAVEVSKSSDLVAPGFLIRAIGELGIAEWLAGRQDAAVRVLVECADRLLLAGETEEDWKQLVPVAVHVLNFIASRIRGVNLTHEANGTPYAVPAMGFFFNADEKYEAYYQDDKPIVLAALEVALAGRVSDSGASERAAALLADRLHQAPPRAKFMVAVNAGAYMASRGLIQELIGSAWNSLDKPHPAELPALPTNWDDRDQSVLFFGLPQAILGVCLGFIDGPEQGRNRLTEMCAALRRLDADGSKAQWSKIADIAETAVSDATSLAAVVKAVSSVPNGIIQSVLMLLSVFHRQATPEFAARTQALALPPLWPMFLKEADSADILLVGYLRGFWSKLVAEQDFRFRRPTEIASELSAAARLEGIAARVYTLLRTVLDGLAVDVEFDRTVFVEPA